MEAVGEQRSLGGRSMSLKGLLLKLSIVCVM